MGSYVAIAGTGVMLADQRLNRMGLTMGGKQIEAPVKTSIPMVFAGATYAVTTVLLLTAGVWFPIPGIYLLGMTVMLALALWTMLFFLFLISRSGSG